MAEEECFFFKYAYGYINLDSKNIYFTNTGNWSETIGMDEKTPATVRKSKRRRNWILIYLILGSALVMAFNYAMHKNTWFVLLVPLSCIPLYKYLSPELGQKFLVPLQKIKSVSPEEDGVRIVFLNGHAEDDSIFLTGLKPQDALQLTLLLNK